MWEGAEQLANGSGTFESLVVAALWS